MDFRVDTSFRGHRKTRALYLELGADGPWCLEGVWSFAAGDPKTRKGDLTGISDAVLEDAAGWRGAAGVLMSTLRRIGFIDGGPGASSLHNWKKWQPHLYGYEEMCAKNKAAADARWNAETPPPPGVAVALQTRDGAFEISEAFKLELERQYPRLNVASCLTRYATHLTRAARRRRPTDSVIGAWLLERLDEDTARAGAPKLRLANSSLAPTAPPPRAAAPPDPPPLDLAPGEPLRITVGGRVFTFDRRAS